MQKTIRKRLIAAAIDLFVATIPVTFLGLAFGLDKWFAMGIGVILFFLKDISGKSLGKRVMNLLLLKDLSEQTPSLIQRIVRNFLLVIWPIEVLFLFIKGKRMGDILFHTQVC